MIKHGEDFYIGKIYVIKRPELCKVGDHVAIDDYFYCTTNLICGDYVHISPFVSVIGGKDAHFTIGNFCTLSAGVRIICATDAFNGDGLVSVIIPEKYRDKVINEPVIMKDYSSIGTNGILMPGVTLGEGAVLGANSFTKNDIPDWEIWGGSPARFIKKRYPYRMKEYGKILLAS